MGEINKAADFHPLSHVLGKNNALIDPIAQGDVNMIGDAGPGTGAYNHAQNLGATDMLNTVQLFGKVIAGGAAMGAAGGGEAAAGTDLEAAGTSAGAAGSVGESGATSVTQAQAASVPSDTETLGSGGSQMPAATPEPAGGPTAPGGSAGPNAMMPAAVPEPEGGPTAPGGSAEASQNGSTPTQTPDQTGKQADQTQAPKPKLFDTIKTAANILTPVSTLLALAAGRKKPSQSAPPSAPPPPELPVSGTGKNSLSAPIVERSIIQGQIARRGRASTILTNPSDSDSRLGG